MAKKKGGGRRAQYNVTWQDFVLTWQTSETAQEVADKLKMPKSIVFTRASYYRKDGVKLKRLSRAGGRANDVDEMNRFIERIHRGEVKPKKPSTN